MVNLATQKGKKTKVLLEAGTVGWESVFYSELRESLQDYTTAETIEISQIDRDRAYLPQVIRKLNSEKPTHFCIDPRTGSQKSFRALCESFVLVAILGFLKINPIVILTDASIRRWRIQSIILTANIGVIVTFLEVKGMGGLFTHKRVIGPIVMPISEKRLSYLDERNKIQEKNGATDNSVFFIGSLYPKRSDFFEVLNQELQNINSKMQVVFENKSAKVSAEDYWNRISSSKFLITTTFQQENSLFKMDRIDLNQMVFRISEVLAAGKLLFCTDVPGIEEFFQKGIHFVNFTTPEEAARKIDYYSLHVDLAQRIATNGRDKIGELISKKEFWKAIDLMQRVKICGTHVTRI